MKIIIRAIKRLYYGAMWRFCRRQMMNAKTGRSTLFWSEQMLEYDVKTLLV